MEDVTNTPTKLPPEQYPPKYQSQEKWLSDFEVVLDFATRGESTAIGPDWQQKIQDLLESAPYLRYQQQFKVYKERGFLLRTPLAGVSPEDQQAIATAVVKVAERGAPSGMPREDIVKGLVIRYPFEDLDAVPVGVEALSSAQIADERFYKAAGILKEVAGADLFSQVPHVVHVEQDQMRFAAADVHKGFEWVDKLIKLYHAVDAIDDEPHPPPPPIVALYGVAIQVAMETGDVEFIEMVIAKMEATQAEMAAAEATNGYYGA